MADVIEYLLPTSWIKYDPAAITGVLVDAKATVLALRQMPGRRDWVEDLQRIELKREVAGTSRIEGADFTERELDDAIREDAAELLTRAQRQARAAVNTYRWIAAVPDDRPIDQELIREIHRRIVTGADDDHCEPGALRRQDQNVTFGQPRHRGASGGPECEDAFRRLVEAIQNEFRGHDPLLQALAAHYHLAAMHPFLDGNGRTARAVGALLKQRAGLKNACFIAMSNYYYEEKTAYLAALSASGSQGHDLTPFFTFALKGVAIQATRVMRSIQREVAKSVYRSTMYDLFGRLRTPKKRVIAKRQLAILEILLSRETTSLRELWVATDEAYKRALKDPDKGLARDIGGLIDLGAIRYTPSASGLSTVSINLDWPMQITESDFLEKLKKLPKAKTSLVR